MTHVPDPAMRKVAIGRRLIGFGAAGFAAVLVAAPVAHAAPAGPDASSDSGTLPEPAAPTDTPTETGTAPSSPAPTSGSSASSPAPTSSAPTSAAPSTSAPSTPAPSTSAPSSAAPTPASSSAGQPRAKKAQVAPHGDPGPNYGSQKVYVGIQLKSDGTYPADASLNGANVHYVITALDGSSREGDCTPVQDSAATATCPSTFFEGTVLLAPGETGVFTQTMAPLGPGVLTDPDSNTVGPCVVGTGSTDPVTGLPYCGVSPFVAGAPTPQSVTPALGGRAVTFVDPGVPPVAEPDTATVTTGHSTDIYVTANDSSGYAEGPEVTVTLITPPSHGTATGDGYPVRYTPTPGFGGLDSFRYRLDAPNGSSTATVTITVKAPPIATNNAAVTVGGDGTAGQTVTIPVLANDSANGGGPLTLAAVGNPPHGSAVIRGANVLYTPDAGFVGTDLFSYTIRTANGTATATIRVAVMAPVVAAAVSSDQLASTGAASEQLLGLGSLLLLVGGGATVVGRRRRMDA